MAYASTLQTVGAQAEPRVRRITFDDLRDCLAHGWDDFRAIPTQLIFLCVVYPIVGLVAARAADGGSLVPLLFPLISGFALVGPIAALGIYELSRRRERGQPVSWLNVFDVLKSPSLGAIVVVAGMMAAIFFVWMLTASLIYQSFFGDVPPASLGDFAQQVMHTPEGMRMIVTGNIVGLIFAIVVLTLSVISLPLLLDREVGPFVAIRTSVRAVMANPLQMAAWGLIVAALLAIGSALFMVGLAIVLPVLGHATWHLYRKVVVA